MTGSTQDGYAKMMLGGGRSVEGNRSRSGKNTPSKFIAAAPAKRPAAAKPKAKAKAKKSKVKSAKRK